MPAEHFRALIARTGRSPRALCREAGEPQNSLAYWLRPTTIVTRPPALDRMFKYSEIIGCDVEEVHEAFRLDAGVVIGDDLAPDEHKLLLAYRRLEDSDRRRLLTIAEALHTASGRDACHLADSE